MSSWSTDMPAQTSAQKSTWENTHAHTYIDTYIDTHIIHTHMRAHSYLLLLTESESAYACSARIRIRIDWTTLTIHMLVIVTVQIRDRHTFTIHLFRHLTVQLGGTVESKEIIAFGSWPSILRIEETTQSDKLQQHFNALTDKQFRSEHDKDIHNPHLSGNLTIHEATKPNAKYVRTGWTRGATQSKVRVCTYVGCHTPHHIQIFGGSKTISW